MADEKLIYLFSAVVPLIIWYLYNEGVRRRYRYAYIPQLPTSFILGHMKTVGEYIAKGDPNRHADIEQCIYMHNRNHQMTRLADYAFTDMVRKAGSPDMILLDLRPINYPICLIASHTIAEQVTKISKPFPYSAPKSPTMKELNPVIGAHSIISSQGETWKSLRKRFNPGFAPSHLVTLLPQILDKTSLFLHKLDALAASGVEFRMDGLATNLTFDIIGAVTMNMDFGAQGPDNEKNDVVRYYDDLMQTYYDTGRLWLFAGMYTKYLRRGMAKKADAAIKEAVEQKYKEIKAEDDSKHRSVLALALKDTQTLSPELLQSTADQLKSFLFAGHDTTSILLQWLFYALSTHPHCLATIRAEHDSIFGPSPSIEEVRNVFLSRPDETIKALSYTSACIKEALRLWPPASSARRVPDGGGMFVRLDDASGGQEVCLDGMVLYLCHYAIQRDPKVYGDSADDFVPERWLGNTDTSMSTNNEDGHIEDSLREKEGIPSSAWRPFERGPRNCIGQELANLEARVILACTMRRYDFTKVGTGAVKVDEKGMPSVDGKGRYVLESDLFNTRRVTAKPVDGCRMRVKMHTL